MALYINRNMFLFIYSHTPIGVKNGFWFHILVTIFGSAKGLGL